jgi:hypothetical protein
VKRKTQHKSRRTKLRLKFPNTACPTGDIISELLKRVRTHSILIDRKLLKRNRVLSEETQLVHKADNLTTICELTVFKMCDP